MRKRTAAALATFAAIPAIGVGAVVLSGEPPDRAVVRTIEGPPPDVPPCTLLDDQTMMWSPECDLQEPWSFTEQSGWLVCDNGAVGWIPGHRTVDGIPSALNDAGLSRGWPEPADTELIDGVDLPLDEAATIPACDQ